MLEEIGWGELLFGEPNTAEGFLCSPRMVFPAQLHHVINALRNAIMSMDSWPDAEISFRALSNLCSNGDSDTDSKNGVWHTNHFGSDCSLDCTEAHDTGGGTHGYRVKPACNCDTCVRSRLEHIGDVSQQRLASCFSNNRTTVSRYQRVASYVPRLAQLLHSFQRYDSRLCRTVVVRLQMPWTHPFDRRASRCKSMHESLHIDSPRCHHQGRRAVDMTFGVWSIFMDGFGTHSSLTLSLVLARMPFASAVACTSRGERVTRPTQAELHAEIELSMHLPYKLLCVLDPSYGPTVDTSKHTIQDMCAWCSSLYHPRQCQRIIVRFLDPGVYSEQLDVYLQPDHPLHTVGMVCSWYSGTRYGTPC